MHPPVQGCSSSADLDVAVIILNHTQCACKKFNEGNQFSMMDVTAVTEDATAARVTPQWLTGPEVLMSDTLCRGIVSLPERH